MGKKLGANHYIDSQSQNPSEELVKLGGAKVIFATMTNGKAMSADLGGLGINGKLIVIGAANEPLEVPILPLLLKRQSIMGWNSD